MLSAGLRTVSYDNNYGSLFDSMPVAVSRAHGHGLGDAFGGSLSTVAAAAPFTGPAAPFIELGVAVAGLIGTLIHNSGCGQTCVFASNEANQIQAALIKNLGLWQALPNNQKYVSVQQAAVANADSLINALFQYCSNPQLGDAGKRCISERTHGGKWDYYAAYVDPIGLDPNVVPDPVDAALSNVAAGASNLFGGNSSYMLLALAAAFLLLGGSK